MKIDHILSVREPFAHLLVTGIKKIENRSIAFPARVGVPTWVAIHTSANLDSFADSEQIADLIEMNPQIKRAWGRPIDWDEYEKIPSHLWPRMFGRSEIVGAVKVIGSVPFGSQEFVKDPKDVFGGYPGDPEDYGDFATGDHCWVIGEAIRFKHPIVTIGRLGVREMPPEVKALVAETAKTLLTDPWDYYGRPVIHKLPKLPKRELAMYQAEEQT